ncbi:hypothetical protein GW932_01895 [archaeon]|nr:hypothetical protein [archaeon]
MKILAISDTHGDSNLVKKIGEIAKKEKVDLILHAGDVTWFGEETKGIIKPLTDKGEVLIVHGNHEDIETINHLSEVYPTLKNLHKTGIERNEIGFFGSGTTDWGFKEDSENLFNELKEAHSKIKHLKKKIMISHSPPTGSVLELMGFPGSYGVTKAIKKFKPDFVICGHIHEGGGLIEEIEGSKVINASRVPIIFEI